MRRGRWAVRAQALWLCGGLLVAGCAAGTRGSGARSPAANGAPAGVAAASAASAGPDVQWLSAQGEDVRSLGAYAVPGKVTLFDFYADWCDPCRELDRYVGELLARRPDLALRKLNIVSWDTPLARRYIGDGQALPYVVVFGKDRRRVGTLTGFDAEALTRLLERAGK
ncbi:MAG TPA: thioredoxin family protein [Polyangia bacterium]|nr:thioredoxin family protein [Polyangia bacterium]